MDAKENTTHVNSGLQCLTILARLHHLPADPKQLQHEFGSSDHPFATRDLLRAAKWPGLKSRSVEFNLEKLKLTHFPCIAKLAEEHFVLVGGLKETEVLIKDPCDEAPSTLSREEFESRWSGEVILITPRAALGATLRQFDFSWFIPFILKYRKYLSDVLMASFFLQVFALVTPLFFQVVVDKVLVHRGLTTLDVLAIGLLVVSVFEVVLGGMRTYVFAHTTNRIDVALGTDLFKHLLRLPVAYFEARRVGDTVARVRELETIRNFITGSSITLVVDLFFTLVCFGVLYLYSPLLTLIVAATLPLYTILAICITPALRARLHEKFNRGADNQAYLVESVTGIQTLKAAAVEPSTQRRWEERLAAYVAASFKATNLSNIANQTASLINKLMVLGILWLGARLVINGELTVGQLVAFNMIAGRISGPILRLVQLWQDFQQAGISVQRLGDILNAQTEPAHSPSRGSLPDLQGRVTFEHVVFRYQPGGPEVLQDIALDVQPGELIGIVGRSGSGKSTLTKLVQRLYVPESGRVMVDGVDLSMVDTAWLRRSIGVVLQENVLFNRTVRENIAISDPAMPMERVVHAGKMAGAHEFILELAEGYDTMVGELGSNLSGGQRQRIATARALVTDPKILIFDEATSALDFEFEAIIQQNMRYICKGRTVFIIAHRLSSVRIASRILVIEKGRVVETGGDKLFAWLPTSIMKVAISGSAGTGKTALALALAAKHGCAVIAENYDNFFGEDHDFVRPTDRLQRLIFETLEFKNALEIDQENFVADRCPVDLFNLWLSRGFGQNQKKTADLYNRCRSTIRKYDCITVLPWSGLPLKQLDKGDGVRRRVMNVWTQLHNHSTMIGLLQQWIDRERLLPIPHAMIDIKMRTETVSRFVNKRLRS